uniref:Mitochondrial carrier protein n=1 Tax=Neobodo designis TaxID=312471 RepID=A0A7S1LE74_NEODS
MSDAAKEHKDTSQVLSEALAKARKDALRGGLPGMIAMACQVLSLMWLRTAVNYQYRHGGTSMIQALKTLYKEGGIRRLYSGVSVALVQAPLSRFGDTAANAGMLSLVENLDGLKDLPVQVKTVFASVGAGSFRIMLMPVDAVKTSLQVDGKKGLGILANKIKTGGPLVLFRGALAASTATFVGHYPWFATYNYLDEKLAKPETLPQKLMRAAFMGWCSSFVSDCCSNSIRVVKTVRQTSAETMSYPQVVKHVVATDGVIGLFGRGLTTKLVTNGVQGIMFSVLWRLGQDYYKHMEDKKKN